MHARRAAGQLEYLLTEGCLILWRLMRARAGLRPRLVRHVDHVRSSYDQFRAERRDVGTLDEYIYFETPAFPHVLLDGRVQVAARRLVRQRVLSFLGDQVERHVVESGEARPVIVEFGSGAGENLLYLKRRLPQIRAIGLELSPVSVAVSREAAARYGVDVEFFEADVSAAVPSLPERVTLSYSVHALEQMPRTFRPAVDLMLARSTKAVLFIEPVAELFSNDLRGRISAMRIKEQDYLDGLYEYLKEISAKIVNCQELMSTSNPLNPSIFVEVLTSGPTLPSTAPSLR